MKKPTPVFNIDKVFLLARVNLGLNKQGYYTGYETTLTHPYYAPVAITARAYFEIIKGMGLDYFLKRMGIELTPNSIPVSEEKLAIALEQRLIKRLPLFRDENDIQDYIERRNTHFIPTRFKKQIDLESYYNFARSLSLTLFEAVDMPFLEFTSEPYAIDRYLINNEGEHLISPEEDKAAKEIALTMYCYRVDFSLFQDFYLPT